MAEISTNIIQRPYVSSFRKTFLEIQQESNSKCNQVGSGVTRLYEISELPIVSLYIIVIVALVSL